MARLLKLVNIAIAITLVFSCCACNFGWSAMQTQYYSNHDSIYEFDFSLQELSVALNQTSNQYYLGKRNIAGPLDSCKSPNQYQEWTICYSIIKHAIQRCGYQISSTLNKQTKKK